MLFAECGAIVGDADAVAAWTISDGTEHLLPADVRGTDCHAAIRQCAGFIVQNLR